MTTRQRIILLESKGYEIRYVGRPDGGVRIKEIDGKVYKLSEGNKVARQLLNKPLSAGQVTQRKAGRAKMAKGISKVLSKAHKETRKQRKKEGASAKQIAKYQQEYREEQQAYRKERANGKTPAQARRSLKKRVKANRSPTIQHANYWNEKKQKSSGFNYPNIDQFCVTFGYRDTQELLSQAVAVRSAKNTQAMEALDEEAWGILYEYQSPKTSQGRREQITQEDAPAYENRLRHYLESIAGKQTRRPLGDVLTFLYMNHQARLYNPFRRKYREGKVSDSEIQLINDTLQQIYQRRNISDRKLLSSNLIDVIKAIVNR